MRLRSIRAQNFRSLLDQTVALDDLTALVGANGVGKSSVLRALEFFYTAAPRIENQDFYAEDLSQNIIITATYSDLSLTEAIKFAQFVADGQVTIARHFEAPSVRSSARFYGFSLKHPGFSSVRVGLEVKDRGVTARTAYDGLRAQPAYSSLPAWTVLKQVPQELEAWEKANAASCTRERDDGATIGLGEQFECNLQQYTRLLYVPAVRDATADGDEGRGSVLTALMDLLVRRSLASDSRLERLRERSQRLYERALDPARLKALPELAQQLTTTLQTLVPDSSIELDWLPLQRLDLPLPSANVTLVEDGYGTAVERTGHGLQRAFIITILQHLASAQASADEAVESNGSPASAHGPDLVLAIEEPELYQHPNRQRHFAKTLSRLATGVLKGLAEHTQVVYATHSPLFVGLDRIGHLRLLRRITTGSTRPKTTQVVSVGLESVAERLWMADGSVGTKFTTESLLPRLRSIMSPAMSEGFFARAVVLVEGEDDRAALLGVAEYMNFDLEAAGLSIIPTGGKTSLDRPYAIFDSLGIPCYPVWDGDQGVTDARPHDNHRLQSLLGLPLVDWPPTTVDQKYACFQINLDVTIRSEIGTVLFDRLLKDCQLSFGIPKAAHARKNPSVLAHLISEAHGAGATCPSLNQILEAAKALTN